MSMSRFEERVRNFFKWWQPAFDNKEDGCRTEWGENCFNLLYGIGQGLPVVLIKEADGCVSIWDFSGEEHFDDVKWEDAEKFLKDMEAYYAYGNELKEVK